MSYCVLLVEDEGLIRTTLAETLEDAGYTVVSAENGDVACNLLKGKEERFDVLLTDIQMPGSADGIDVARDFHARHPDRPVVFMTGRPDMLSRMGRLSCCERLLRKPFGSAQMLNAIQVMLGGRNAPSSGAVQQPSRPRRRAPFPGYG